MATPCSTTRMTRARLSVHMLLRVILPEQNDAREHTATRPRAVDKSYLYVCTVSDGHRSPTTATPGDTCSPIHEPYTAHEDNPQSDTVPRLPSLGSYSTRPSGRQRGAYHRSGSVRLHLVDSVFDSWDLRTPCATPDASCGPYSWTPLRRSGLSPRRRVFRVIHELPLVPTTPTHAFTSGTLRRRDYPVVGTSCQNVFGEDCLVLSGGFHSSIHPILRRL